MLLPISEFYTHKKMADRHLNFCKNCVKNRIQLYRQENIEKIREYDRQRGRTAEHIQKNIAYAEKLKTEYPQKYKEMEKKRSDNYIQQHPDRRQAHMMVYAKIRNKNIVKKPCEVCGTTRKIEAHHDDYAKPLEIRWLCKKHHMELHRALNDQRRVLKREMQEAN